MSETLLSLFEERVRRGPGRPALRYRSGGLWRPRSWREWRDRSRAIAAGLADLGVETIDRVAILAPTSIRWIETDLGVLYAGAVTVPIYPSLRPDTVGQILRDSAARVLFVQDPVQLAKILEAGTLETLTHAVVLERVARLLRPDEKGRLDVSVADVLADGAPIDVLSFDSLLERGRARLERAPDELSHRTDALTPNSLAALYYTSGTDGEPKGVPLTHDNFVFETKILAEAFDVSEADEQLLFLPLAHIVAKLTMMLQLRVGFVTSFSDSVEEALADCEHVRPTFLVGVPRVYEKLQEAIEGAPRSGPEERVFRWALSVGGEVSRLRQRGAEPPRLLRIQHRSAERLVFGRIHERLGGRLRFMLSGAAPLDRRTAEFFHSIGLLVLEGYGLTESTGASTLNLPGAYRFGTVGRPLDGVAVSIADDSEVLLRGRSITRGFWGDAADPDAFTEDGAFRTGDLGAFDADGYLRITGRKKNLIITAGGKNIAPSRIERRLRSGAFIERAVVLGDRRKFPIALLKLDPEAVLRWAREQGISGDYTVAAKHPKVRRLIAGEVESVNEGLAQFEAIKRFDVIEGDLSVRAGTLTPTGRVRRTAVAQRYSEQIDALYESASSDLLDVS